MLRIRPGGQACEDERELKNAEINGMGLISAFFFDGEYKVKEHFYG